MSDDQLKTPLLPPNQSFEMNQFPITVELSNVLGKQYHEENYASNYMKLDQILIARNRWKNLIKEQFHPRVPKEKEKSSYFQIDIKRLQQLFDIGYIKEQTWMNEKQKRAKQVNTEAEKHKYLKTQLDMLFQLGGVYGISNFLRSNIKNGLNTEDKTDLIERKKYFGPNDKPPLATKGILLVIIWLLKYDRLVQVQFISLILFTSLNLIKLKDLDDCFAIFVGLVIMIIFKSLMRQIYNRHVIIHQTEMKHRNCSQSQKLKVWRNGDIEMIDNKDILVGDILFFQQGDYLLCDGILIQQNSIQILVTQPTQDLIEQYCEKNVEDTKVSEQETESFKVYDPFLFSGSHIIEGAGQLLVCSIGQMASDYIAFQQNFAEDSSQKKYLRQNPMYNPFSLKLESVMSRQTILSSFLMIILILQMLFQYAVWDPEQILGLILYVSLMIPLIVPLNLVQFLNLYMIDIIQTLRMKEIYLKDYLALFWLGQVNEVILDQLNQSVQALKNSNINLRWFSTDFQDICRQLALHNDLIQENDPIELMFVDSIQIQQMFNEKNKFTFTSRRFASPTVDYVKIDKITSGKTLDQIESRGSTFAFHGVVDAESLYEHIKYVSVVSRCSHKDKELLISFLKLFDRIILLSGDDSDRLAMEIAHISIGKMDSQAAIRLGNNNLVDSVYNSLGCGRCVYFIIHQVSKAYCSSAVLILVTNIVWQYACELFLFQFLNMLALNVVIYIISLYFSYNLKDKLTYHLMERSPFQRIMRITDGYFKLFFFKSIVIVSQLILISYFGRLEELQLIIDGLILNDHIGTLTRPIISLSIMIKSALFGLILIVAENYLSTGTQYIYEVMIYRDYLIGLLIIHINQSLFYQFSKLNKFTVAIIGRSSVGKSSLFNKLQDGENQTITSSMRNITRDRQEAISRLFQVPVRFVDTAGIENVALNRLGKPLEQKMMIQTLNAIEYANMAMFVVDAKVGLTSIDFQIAKWLKKLVNQKTLDDENIFQLKDLSIKSNVKSAILVANKCENDRTFDTDINTQLKKLGLGDPVYVSAVDGTGFQDLLARIQSHIPGDYQQQLTDVKQERKLKYQQLKEKHKQELIELFKDKEDLYDIKQWEREFDQANPNPEENSDLDDDANSIYTGKVIQESTGVTSENLQRRNPIQLCIIGRPNVGKSSLVNTLLGFNRVISDDTPGTTRDPVSSSWVYNGQRIELIDTAGIDKNKIESCKDKQEIELQRKIESKTRQIIRFSHVVILLIDSLGQFKDQDLDIAQKVVEEGRALIIAVNKWDIVDNEYKPRILKYLQRQLEKNLAEVADLPILAISAEKKINIDQLMEKVISINDKWNTRISTGLLNEWLNKFKKIQSAPSDEGEKLKIRYLAQIKVRPPTFAIFINSGALFKSHYLKFLRNRLSKEFNIYGVPIRFVMRDIQYAKEKKKLEKDYGGSVREKLLKRRRLVKLAKQKLESLNKSKQK